MGTARRAAAVSSRSAGRRRGKTPRRTRLPPPPAVRIAHRPSPCRPDRVRSRIGVPVRHLFGERGRTVITGRHAPGIRSAQPGRHGPHGLRPPQRSDDALCRTGADRDDGGLRCEGYLAANRSGGLIGRFPWDASQQQHAAPRRVVPGRRSRQETHAPRRRGSAAERSASLDLDRTREFERRRYLQ